jgi:hypothetical protein
MHDRTEEHPSLDELRAFDQGRLGSAEWSAVERHLVGCPVCSRRIEEIPEERLADLLRDYDAADTPQSSGTAAPPAVPPGDAPAELARHPRYRLLGVLGAGGHGKVFKAEHLLMRREVALKIIHPHLLAEGTAVERFRQEVRAAARLSHPNIVAALDAEQSGELHFLVMEFVEGETLDRLLKRRGPLPVAEACDHVRQAAVALQHAFERGMVHRDLKPANLMVTRGGQVKILDFGLAQLAREQGALTPQGTLLGTPAYLAPEQARDPHTSDIRADLYSLGCTLYHLLAGRPPFPEGTVLQQLLAHQDRTPPPLTSLRPDVPAALARTVERLLAKDPTGRPQTPAELAEALAPFAAPEVGTGRGPAAPRRVVRWPLLLAAGIGVVLLAAVGLLVWHLVSREDRVGAKPDAQVKEREDEKKPQGGEKKEDKSPAVGTRPPPAWTPSASARDQAVAWLRANNRGGPNHPVVGDAARELDRMAKGAAFVIRLGPALVRSGKPTALAGRHHDLFTFELTPKEAVRWIRDAAFDYREGKPQPQTYHPRPLVRLEGLRVDNAHAFDARAKVTGSLAYRKLDDVPGLLALRLTCMPERRTVTVFDILTDRKLAREGRLAFTFSSIAREDDPARQEALVLFFELGIWREQGTEQSVEIVSNVLAAPVFPRPPEMGGRRDERPRGAAALRTARRSELRLHLVRRLPDAN